MTHRCNENKTQSELVYDDLSDGPNNTCDENEFSDSSDILELSDVITQRKIRVKNITFQVKVKIRRWRLMSL